MFDSIRQRDHISIAKVLNIVMAKSLVCLRRNHGCPIMDAQNGAVHLSWIRLRCFKQSLHWEKSWENVVFSPIFFSNYSPILRKNGKNTNISQNFIAIFPSVG